MSAEIKWAWGECFPPISPDFLDYVAKILRQKGTHMSEKRFQECPKCGATTDTGSAAVRHRAWHGGPFVDPTRAWGTLGSYPQVQPPVVPDVPRCGQTDQQFEGEHLHVWCGVCGWNWREETRDAKAAREEPSPMLCCTAAIAVGHGGVGCRLVAGHPARHRATGVIVDGVKGTEFTVEWDR